MNFLNLRQEFETAIQKIDKVESLLIKAFRILYNLYKDYKKQDPNVKINEILDKLNENTFTEMWDTEILNKKEEDGLYVSGHNMFHYIKARCKTNLKIYLECSELLDF